MRRTISPDTKYHSRQLWKKTDLQLQPLSKLPTRAAEKSKLLARKNPPAMELSVNDSIGSVDIPAQTAKSLEFSATRIEAYLT